MKTLQLAELRASIPAWLSVSLTFLVTSFALSLSALTWLAGSRAVASGELDIMDSAGLVFIPAMNMVFCAIIGAVVINSATELVVEARRGALARLALNGATPGQVVATIVTQLVAVSLAASLVGSTLAMAVLQPALAYLGDDRNAAASAPMPIPEAVYSPWPVLGATLLTVAVATVGGWRQARLASRIDPVEALRQAQHTKGRRGMTISRWIGFGAAVATVIGFYVIGIPTLTATRTKETISNLIIYSTVVLIAVAVALAMIAPLIVGPLSRAWTALIPVSEPSWQLARRSAAARATRLSRSVVPVMLTIGLAFGFAAMGAIMQGTLAANGIDVELTAAGATAMILPLALPLLVSLSGAVGVLIMMSRQRDAELALLGVAGATPRQRVVMPILEAVIITGTGTLLALCMVLAKIGFLAIGFPAADFAFGLTLPFEVLAVTLAASAAIIISATLLPTLRALRQPEPAVIASLVAD